MTTLHETGDALRWAIQDINELEADGDIDAGVAQRGREAVEYLFRPDTVYASVGPIDDGDLCLYWVAGPRSVSIEIEHAGRPGEAGIWYAVGRGDGRRDSGVVSAPTEFLRDALAEFSAAVEAVNPDWRKLSPRYVEGLRDEHRIH
ncbi:uncharacterized protein RMCC_5868 [Mycolicibacterium canariasense]|uniref:Immunity protein Imm1 n=1 Tax=Mycolicibacterium canariasense TaxID=228230 RepID=A0A100WJD2_MYCCR|nr:hypothetical protein [Mycolicibacterium canariasense]MCV7210535.1 hypothetical protein [Mycolicibacterium canariasense]ORU96129.1 hypothetical protein AWB94_31185 [Mycolicibacterium canariasense]GAS98903.1 uncharacterized protein RMCC_5868 [Mycolicibacterium canariasense]